MVEGSFAVLDANLPPIWGLIWSVTPRHCLTYGNATPFTCTDISPQMFGAYMTGGEYDAKPADVWACGVLLYGLLYGAEPWITDAYRPSSRERQRTIELLLEAGSPIEYKIPPAGGRHVSPATLDLLAGMLEHDLAKRLTLAQVKAHPFFEGYAPPKNVAASVPRAQGEAAIPCLPPVLIAHSQTDCFLCRSDL